MRVRVTAVITVVRMPRMKTTAKPRTGPDPRKNRITAAMAMVLFEFGRDDPDRTRALVTAYDAAGGPARVRGPEDFGVAVAQLHHIGRYQVLGWLHARDPEARARAHAAVRELLDEPLTVPWIHRLVSWAS